MTDTELREAIGRDLEVVSDYGSLFDWQKKRDEIMGRFTHAQTKLLREVLEGKEALHRHEPGKPYATERGGLANTYESRIDAVPVSVIEQKIKELE